MTLPRAQRPGIATARVMALVTGFLYTIGGVAGVAGGTQGQLPPVSLRLVVLGAVASVVGLAVMRWGGRFPTGAYHAVFVSGTALIACGAVIAPDLATATALCSLSTFVALAAFFYFAWPGAMLHMIGALVACAVALLQRPLVTGGTIVVMVLCCLGVATVVGGLAHRATSAGQDPVTELANRRGLDETLEEMLRQRARTGEPLAAALLDIDFFKSVNDTQGHTAGDQLLRRLGQQWSAMLPSGAMLARHGGDEFALLLPRHDGAEALLVVERLRAAAEVSLSCGVTAHHRVESASQLLRRADRALYQAKSAGRGRSVLDDGGVGEALAADLALALDEAAFAAARAHDDVPGLLPGLTTRHPRHGLPLDVASGVHAVYQPIVSLEDGSFVGVEVLARWTHPLQGPVPPAQFIPVAESSGLISRLGAIVAAEAFRDLVALRDATGRELLLTVNVSGLQLCDPEFPAMIERALRTSGWDAASTVIEVTESLVEGETSAAVAALTSLRGSGLRIAIDDFGTGYSALSRLDTLPTDYLKLDCSFVAPVSTSPRRAQLIESILMLARALDLRVIAEGVETEDQATALRGLGCELAQGYFFCRPVPIEEVVAAIGVVPAHLRDVARQR